MDEMQQFRDAVARPGKFQGEKPYVPYFWETMETDDMEGGVFTYYVQPVDVKLWPELAGRNEVCLCEDPDGFVFEIKEQARARA